MVVRDRPSSDVPARTAERATDLVGITLAADEVQSESDGDSSPKGENRTEGAGALRGRCGIAAAATAGRLQS